MLYLDSGVTIRGITLYRDYNELNHYYYAGFSPSYQRRAARRCFSYCLYRRDITDNPAFKEGDRLGGGF
jgi:hypothetical protein